MGATAERAGEMRLPVVLAAGALLFSGCGTAQVGGQTGDENSGDQCVPISSTTVAIDTAGPGGFSTVEALGELHLIDGTTLEWAPEFSTNSATNGSNVDAAKVSVSCEGTKAELVDYAIIDENAESCVARLHAPASVAVARADSLLVRDFPVELEFLSPSYATVRGQVSARQVEGLLPPSISETEAESTLSMIGGLTSLGSWGRISTSASAEESTQSLIAAWPRTSLCIDRGVPIGSELAVPLLEALPKHLRLEANSEQASLVQDWAISLDVATFCVIPALNSSTVDKLTVEASLLITDTETGSEGILHALLSAPLEDHLVSQVDLSLVGKCASVGLSLPSTAEFEADCADWHTDFGNHDSAHLELNATWRPGSGLSGLISLFGDDRSDCVDIPPSSEASDEEIGSPPCAGIVSTRIEQFEINVAESP